MSVTTSDFNTQQILANITGVLSQAVAVPYYTIDQLSSDVQQRVCQAAIDANIYWDVRQDERNRSFDAICESLDLQWSCDNYDNYYVEETSCDYLARHFEKEYQTDYEQATSIDYAIEFLCQDNYYTWQGKDITDIVNAYMVAK